MEGIKRSCDFRNDFDMNSVGSSGGLLLGWRNNVTVLLRSPSGSNINFFWKMIRMGLNGIIRVFMASLKSKNR